MVGVVCVYEAWTEGIGWERYEVPASKVPRISEEFLQEERRQGERYYQQEFECKFVDTDDQVFRNDIIEAAFDYGCGPLWEDFSVDGVAEYLFEGGRWARAEVVVSGRPQRTLEQIE